MSFKERLNKLSKYAIVPAFLAMEVFAFIGFSFGGSFVLYGSLTLALVVLLIIFSIREINRDGLTNTLILLFPIVMFSLLICLGTYMRSHVYVGDYTLAEEIFVPIGLISVCLCGYLLGINKTFKLKTFLIVLYGSIAALVLVNLFANLINFGPFHTLLYKGYYMYYAGKRSSVPADKMAYTLEGFQIIESSITHYVLYPGLLLTSVFMLFKTSFKQEKKLFLIYALYTLIAVLALVLVPCLLGLVFVILIGAIIGIIYLYNKVEVVRKPLRIAMYVVIILGALLFLIMLINNQSVFSGISDVIANNSLLNRLFNTNGIVSKYNNMLTDVIGKNFLGYASMQVSSVVGVEVHMSGSFFFDAFMFSGVIGVVALSFYLIKGLFNFKKYFLNSDDEKRYKYLLLIFILTFYAFSFLFYDGEYGIYYSIYRPFYMSGPFLITLFIFAYIATKGVKPVKEESVNEEITA